MVTADKKINFLNMNFSFSCALLLYFLVMTGAVFLVFGVTFPDIILIYNPY
jgi:hypothetical protein